MAKFFIVTPPGFESQTLQELKEIWPLLLGKDAKAHDLPFPAITELKGGLEFECEFFTGLQLNFFLKTASRVLLRLTSFRTRDFPKFYQKVKALPWTEYLQNGNVEWVINAQKSRLNNEKRLLESAVAALSEIFPEAKNTETKIDTKNEPCASIFIRMDDDQCTVSLDTTGEHLHKRGWSFLKGEAPLRETISLFLLKKLMADAQASKLTQVRLVDPMMGSGTFLSEARSMNDGQFARPFAFQKFKKCPKLFLLPGFALNYRLPADPPFVSYTGYDLDSEMTTIAAKNFAETEEQIQAIRKKTFKAATVSFKQGNSLTEAQAEDQGAWLITNPPYGERLTMVLEEDGLKAIVEGLIQQFKPGRLGVLYPARDRLKKAPKDYKIKSETNVNNGGLHTVFTVLEKI